MGKRRNVWLLTGGIGSGKSTIRKMMSERGALTIDADQVGHQVLEPGGAAHDEVAGRWPEVVFEGIIDRKRLADIVFNDSAELHALEAISHPAISATLRKWVKNSDADVIVVEMSVPRDFLGVGPARTIVADVDMATRRKRLVDKGMALDDVNRRMANQPNRDGWVERGGWVICTDGSLEDVAERVDRLWPQIEALS